MKNEKNLKIPEINDNNWFKVDSRLISKAIELELNATSILIYTFFCRNVYNDTQQYSITMRKLCEKLKIKRRSSESIKKSIKQLIEKGMIEESGIDTENKITYTLIDNWLGVDGKRANLKENWFWIDNIFIDYYIHFISKKSSALYIAIRSYVKDDTFKVFPAFNKKNDKGGLCDILKINRSTCNRSVKQLKEFNLIDIERRQGDSNTYTFIDRGGWILSEQITKKYEAKKENREKATSDETIAKEEIVPTEETKEIAMIEETKEIAIEGVTEKETGVEETKAVKIVTERDIEGTIEYFYKEFTAKLFPLVPSNSEDDKKYCEILLGKMTKEDLGKLIESAIGAKDFETSIIKKISSLKYFVENLSEIKKYIKKKIDDLNRMYMNAV